MGARAMPESRTLRPEVVPDLDDFVMGREASPYRALSVILRKALPKAIGTKSHHFSSAGRTDGASFPLEKNKQTRGWFVLHPSMNLHDFPFFAPKCVASLFLLLLIPSLGACWDQVTSVESLNLVFRARSAWLLGMEAGYAEVGLITYP